MTDLIHYKVEVPSVKLEVVCVTKQELLEIISELVEHQEEIIITTEVVEEAA